MSAWSNLEISPDDPELIRINHFEEQLGELPPEVHKIRELITRHEACHFKYQRHIQKIIDAILELEPGVDTDKIGAHHIQHGEHAWTLDTTGRSLLGQQYVWVIQQWLDTATQNELPAHYNRELGSQIHQWLGEKSAIKARLVRLLLARITWDWSSYEELQHGGEYQELEFQICRMDICHYAFPSNLDRLLKGIGEMKPIENFEGCGSFDDDIREFVAKKLHTLKELSKSIYDDRKSDEKALIKVWLIACLMKTLKEQVKLSEPPIEI